MRERTRAAANHATEASLAKAKENQSKACLSGTCSCNLKGENLKDRALAVCTTLIW